MSYAAIRTALATRLQALNAGRTQSYVRFSIKSVQDPEFQALFVAGGRVNVWQLTRTRFFDRQAPDRDNLVIRRHELELTFTMSLQDSAATENLHQDALDLVANNLATGDRTLGGACHTHGLVDVRSIERIMFFESVLAHHALMTLTVEEFL